MKLPDEPCFAVIFSAWLSDDSGGYAGMAEHMERLVAGQPGFLGMESARGADGFGITVSYWRSLEAIARWREHPEHRRAQALGKARWYRSYSIRVARVEPVRSGSGPGSSGAAG